MSERKRLFPRQHGFTIEELEQLPPRPTNDELSALEAYEFVHDPPKKYTVYISEGRRLATTWTGEKLGSVTFGSTWHDNWGGTRQSVWVDGINGVRYQGTYFKSAGDYAHVRAVKS